MNRLLYPYACALSICTLLLLCAGALVTSTGSGLAVPDWPLSYGALFPRMVGGVLFEHGHRLLAGFIALLTGIQCYLFLRAENRRGLKILACALLGIVCVQALFGGLTVLFRLPPPVSIIHALLAQTFFSLQLSLTLFSSPLWRDLPNRSVSFPESLSLPKHAFILTVLFFFQLVLGAATRHLKAGLSIPDFPTSFGQWLPPLADPRIAIHFFHRVGAFVLLIVAVVLVIRILRDRRLPASLSTLAGGLLTLMMIQILLGALTIWLKRPITITVLHVANGAFCLGTSLVLTLCLFRVWSGAMNPTRSKRQAYLELTKPRICALALAMTTLGYYLGSDSPLELGRLILTLVGTTLVGAAAGAFNHYYERDVDALMVRTSNRPLPTETLTVRETIRFGFILGLVGELVLLFGVNLMTGVLGAFTLFFYLLIYTPSKRVSSLSTLIGAIPGAIPPLMGWTAAKGVLTAPGLILFGILFLWQIPHFLAIAWIYREDYERARIPVLPVIDLSGNLTARNILTYTFALLPVSLMPSVFGLTGSLYFFGALFCGLLFAIASAFVAVKRTKATARGLFLTSIVYLPVLGILMALDRL